MSSARVWMAVALGGALAFCVGAASCSSSSSSSPSEQESPTSVADLAYPSGPYAIAAGGTLPDLAFEGIDAAGARVTHRLRDFHIADDAEPRVLVIEVIGGAWCGTCRWTASHFDDAVGSELRARIDRFDLVVRDRDNAPAEAERDASGWKQAANLNGVPIGVDPAFVMGAALEGKAAPLPLILLVDESTMSVAHVLSNPDPVTLANKLAATVADLDGNGAPAAGNEPLVDGMFHANEWDMFVAMAEVPAEPPPDPTNEVADRSEARKLGKTLFFDAGLSPSGTVSCATCHDPSRALSDGRARAEGVGPGNRRTPSIALSSHQRWLMWDGRADTSWSQALGPIENPAEFGSSRVFVARRIIGVYGPAYRAAFPGSTLPSASSWPARGKPGDPAYDGMSDAEKREVTAIFVHAGKAIAAYERTFRVAPTSFDAYIHGDHEALSADEKYGLQLFARSGCMQCHWGPRLTDDAFHDTRSPNGVVDGQADRGRAAGLEQWIASEFRADGAWSAAPEARRPARVDPTMAGQFKTPSLRGVAELSYFGHGGELDALSAVTEAYGRGGVPADDPSCAGTREPWLMDFGETAQWALVPFLRTLSAHASSD